MLLDLRSSRGKGWILLVGLALHGAALALLLLGPLRPVFHDTRVRPRAFDLTSIYEAGVRAAHRQPVYAPAMENAGLGIVDGRGMAIVAVPPFRYPPAAAYSLGVGVAAFPRESAPVVWLVLCELLLFANLALCWRASPDGRTFLLAAGAWLFFTPLLVDLWLGQFTFLTASLVFWAAALWLRGRRAGPAPAGGARERWAELCWGAAVVVKAMPLLYAPLLLKLRRAEAVWRVGTLLVASTALYFILWPEDFSRFYASNLLPVPQQHFGNQGLAALLHLLCGEHGPAFQRVYAAAAGAVLALALWATARAAPSRGVWLLGLWSAAFLLGYRDVWEHHYLLLAPYFALLALETGDRPGAAGPERWVRAVSALAFLLLTLPSPFSGAGYGSAFSGGAGGWRADALAALAHHSWKVAPTLVLFVALAAGLARDSGRSRAPA